MTLYESIVLETRNGALGDTFELQELTKFKKVTPIFQKIPGYLIKT